jgi:hypothetical protein
MHVLWTAHLKDEASRESFRQSLRSSNHVLERLHFILEKKLESLEKDSQEDYSIAAWPFYQADKNGAKRTLNEIISLITLDK